MGNPNPRNDFEYFEGLLDGSAIEAEIDDNGGYRVNDGILLVSQFEAFNDDGSEKARTTARKADAAQLGYERLRRIKAMISIAKTFLISQDVPADKMDMVLDSWIDGMLVLRNREPTIKDVFLAFSSRAGARDYYHREE